MKIGTIAQHANVGSGRINDHNIWLHHDYTDSGSVTVRDKFPAHASGSLITSCSDSGPHGMTAKTGFFTTFSNTGKAAAYNTAGKGQNNHNYALSFRTEDSQSDSQIQWVNAVEPLNMRNFTMVYVFDYEAPLGVNGFRSASFFTGGSDIKGVADQTYLKLTGAEGESGIIEQFNFGIDSFDIGFGAKVLRYQVQCVHGDGTIKTLTTGQIGNTTTNLTTWLSAINGGDANYNFNYMTVVGKSDGEIELYIRGVKALSSSNFFPDETVKAGAVSHAFNNAVGGSNASTAKIYEYIIFDKALDTQELYDVDWYIANKYKYQQGRAYGKEDIQP